MAEALNQYKQMLHVIGKAKLALNDICTLDSIEAAETALEEVEHHINKLRTEDLLERKRAIETKRLLRGGPGDR